MTDQQATPATTAVPEPGQVPPQADEPAPSHGGPELPSYPDEEEEDGDDEYVPA